MSFRATLINFLLRRTLKKMLIQQGADIPVLRHRLGASERATGKPRVGVQVEMIDLDGLCLQKVVHDACTSQQAVLYFHGGGYVLAGSAGHIALAGRLSELAGVAVYLVDYRLAPEHPFPAAVDDALKAYQGLLDRGYEASNLIVAGDSAGGGLAAATLLNLKNLGYAQPAAALLLSPWLDLSLSGDSMTGNDDKDVMLSTAVLTAWANASLDGRDSLAPLASPIYGDLAGLAPILVHVGSTEVLRSDSEDFVDRVIEQGGSAVLKVWDDLPHVFQVLLGRVPEAEESVALLAQYCVQQLKPKT